MPRNLCMFRGNLTRDPEIRSTNGKAVGKFSIAVNGFKEGDVEYINCEVWDKTAEFVRDNVVKGDQVDVTSRVKTERWEDKDGNKRQNPLYIVQTLDAIKLKKWEGGGATEPDEDDPKPAKPAKAKKVVVPDDDDSDYDPNEKVKF